MSPPSPRSPRIAFWAALSVFLLTVTSFGVSVGLSTQVSRGPPETGQGAFVAEKPLPYWTWRATQLGTIPAPVPRPVSVNPAAPTVLPRGARSYTINPGVIGQTSVFWTFREMVGAPRSTELEITFVDGLSQPTTTINVYVETSGRGVGGVTTFVFYWDAGSFAPASFAIETMAATVQVCTAIGTCP